MNIIITGASRGIGYELTKLFAADPKNKVVAISRNRLKLEHLKRECRSGSVYPAVVDFSNKEFKRDITLQVLSHISTVDILINNAGALVYKPFEELTPGDIENIFRINVTSQFEFLQALLPYMGKGQIPTHIVNISSMGGLQGSVKFSGLSAYSSSKAALASLTECLAEEFKDRNISVNCLMLGAVQTEMFEEAFPGEKTEMTPLLMAAYIRDFALSGATFFNGKIIPVSKSTP
jgi:NAD(P)-dependent dehydrogenase (short-subunit alcohol dehydrogenase family)